MTSRGFFSVFVAAFAIILLITLIYTQTAQERANPRIAQLMVAEQELSKDWFLARNAYSNFASDAIYAQIRADMNPTICSYGATTPDFAVRVQQYWDLVYLTLREKGVDCKAVLNVNIRNDLEAGNDPGIPAPRVWENERAYGVLTCLRSAGGVDLNYTHPFVILKNIELTPVPVGQCRVQIFDDLGASAAGVPHVGTDIDVTFS